MIRVTIRDPQETITFLTEEATVHRLVAACASQPADGGELLVAAENFEQGLTAAIMGQLMDFDKKLQHEGPEFIHEALRRAEAEGRQPPMTFQVIDAQTEAAALTPRQGELVVFDVAAREIWYTPGIDVSANGEVVEQTSLGPSERQITYLLPRDWQVAQLEDGSSLHP